MILDNGVDPAGCSVRGSPLYLSGGSNSSRRSRCLLVRHLLEGGRSGSPCVRNEHVLDMTTITRSANYSRLKIWQLWGPNTTNIPTSKSPLHFPSELSSCTPFSCSLSASACFRRVASRSNNQTCGLPICIGLVWQKRVSQRRGCTRKGRCGGCRVYQ